MATWVSNYTQPAFNDTGWENGSILLSVTINIINSLPAIMGCIFCGGIDGWAPFEKTMTSNLTRSNQEEHH
jgi:hypothetical protein